MKKIYLKYAAIILLMAHAIVLLMGAQHAAADLGKMHPTPLFLLGTSIVQWFCVWVLWPKR